MVSYAQKCVPRVKKVEILSFENYFRPDYIFNKFWQHFTHVPENLGFFQHFESIFGNIIGKTQRCKIIFVTQKPFPRDPTKEFLITGLSFLFYSIFEILIFGDFSRIFLTDSLRKILGKSPKIKISKIE